MATDPNTGESDVKNNKRGNRFVEILALIVLIGGIVWLCTLFFDFGGMTKTNNAQVDANITSITSRVSGNIKEIRFNAYSPVQAGDTLVIIDDVEFRIKVAQSEADLEIAKANLLAIEQAVITSISNQEASSAKLKGNEANLERAEKNFQRFENMYGDSAVTQNQFDQVTAQLKSDKAFLEASEKTVLADKSTTRQNQINIESSKATVARKTADLEAARLQLSYTVIVAPANGVVGERTIEPGALVNTNQVLASIVQQENLWVTANFKETQLDEIKIGQEVNIIVDALGGKTFPGIVKNLSPATGAKFSMVAPDNSTGNFVRITQRIPVRIEFKDAAKDLQEVKPGMNVTVEVKN